ncbi:Endonuclease/exonuclease/phosphatase, partial [Mycena alexandri]
MPQPAPSLTNLSKLRIWQQNLNKSLASQNDFMNSLTPNFFDIALVQEPHVDWRGVSRGKRSFVSIYPPTHAKDQRATQSAIFVNTRLSSSSWAPIPILSPDITAIDLIGDFGTIRIINIYNDGNHNETL